MNEKVKAILLKIVIELQKLGWSLDADYEVTLHAENYIPMSKYIPVGGTLGNKEWEDKLDLGINLKMETADQNSFYPEYLINGEIFIKGGSIKDINYKTDASVGFMENDFRDEGKVQTAARTINNAVQNHAQEEYTKYLEENGDAIEQYKKGGWRADNDAKDDR
jgi:hypothetical protein